MKRRIKQDKKYKNIQEQGIGHRSLQRASKKGKVRRKLPEKSF